MFGVVYQHRFASGLAVLLIIVAAAAVLRLHPDYVDRPVAKALNQFAASHRVTTEVAAAATYPLLEAAIVVGLIWYCWLSDLRPNSRADLSVSAAAAVLAGAVAYLLRYLMPPTLKPIFDPMLQLHVPTALGDIEVIRAHAFPNSHAFPSERATMFAGLSLAVLLARSDLGILAVGCTAAVELSRVYLGLHYPTEIIGSFALAGALLCLAQLQLVSMLGSWLIGWERASPITFYMCASVATYQVITGFQGLRGLLRSFIRS